MQNSQTIPAHVRKLIADGNIKLNLGSGVDYRQGYINVDLDPGAKPDLLMDYLETEKVIPPASVQEIMMMHSLNYLTLWQARALFRLAQRLIAPGGKLIIETVDLSRAIEKISTSTNNFNEYIEGVRALHAFGIDQLQREEMYFPNRFSWTSWHLNAELTDAGWQDVQILEPETHNPWRDMRFVCNKPAATTTVREKSNDRPTTDGRKKTRVLIFHDAEGWAWWHRAQQIKNNIGPDFEIEIAELFTPVNVADYDLFLVFDGYPTEDPRWNIPNERTIIGCSCPKLYERTISRLTEKTFAGAIINNYATWKKASHRNDVFCCPNGVDLEKFYPAKNPGNDWIACWVGNSQSMGNKGLELIVEACNYLGIELRYLDKQAIGGDGLYTQEEIRDELYHQCSFYICASEYEGTPNPALEALACGLPVISTAVGNMSEVIRPGYNGIICERNVPAIIKAIKELQDYKLSELRHRSRVSVETGWSWKEQVKNYETTFHTVEQRLRHSGLIPERITITDSAKKKLYRKADGTIFPLGESDSQLVGGKVLFLLDPNLGHATVHTRGLRFASSFQRSAWKAEFIDVNQTPLQEIIARAKESDITYLLKVASLPLVNALREQTKTRVVFDLTDALWEPLHRTHGWQDLEEILERCHALTSENAWICDFGKKHNKHIISIPACTLIEEFNAQKALVKKDPSKIILGWIGSNGTARCFSNILRPLETLFALHPQLALRIVGCSDTSYLPAFENVRYSMRGNYNDESMVEEILGFDIGLYPPPFDRADYTVRGAQKAMFYMSAGVPPVCLNAGDVTNVIDDGITGILANDEQEWQEKLEAIIRSRFLREEMGRRAKESISAQHSAAHVFRVMEETFEIIKYELDYGGKK
ncbi:MAG: glycosyltransferase [bacterium]|nr:glycosyltransferase [bacterium]